MKKISKMLGSIALGVSSIFLGFSGTAFADITLQLSNAPGNWCGSVRHGWEFSFVGYTSNGTQVKDFGTVTLNAANSTPKPIIVPTSDIANVAYVRIYGYFSYPDTPLTTCPKPAVQPEGIISGTTNYAFYTKCLKAIPDNTVITITDGETDTQDSHILDNAPTGCTP
ncbi:MAG: hypothetical protein KIT27_01440 [Legionellales bacterium]|nr:hypothetical protein [Legionellales bacterium]